MTDIVFLTPGNSVEIEYFKSMIKTIKVLDSQSITWDIHTKFSSHVAVAREQTLSDLFIHTDSYKMLLWVDSDIVWRPEDVLRAYESDKDVLTGCYAVNGDESMTAATMDNEWVQNWYIEELDYPVRVDTCGMGFLAMKAGVIEKIDRPVFSSDIKTSILGEDIILSRKLRALGIDIWLDPKLRLGHVKKTITRI